MADDLIEIHERLQNFCNPELTVLRGEIKSFFRDALSIRSQPSPNTATYSIFVTQTKPIATTLKSRAGAIANEARSCLDALACALAIRNKRDEKGVYFPISKSEAIFKTDGMKKIRKLSGADQAKIIALKPYAEGNPLLFGLHEADRMRKHQRSIGCAVHNTSARIGRLASLSGGSSLKIGKLVVDGTVISQNLSVKNLEISPDEVGKEFCIAENIPTMEEIRLVYDICYLRPQQLDGKSVSDSLERFVREVDKIVSTFD